METESRTKVKTESRTKVKTESSPATRMKKLLTVGAVLAAVFYVFVFIVMPGDGPGFFSTNEPTRSVSIETLLKDYTENEVRGDALYKGKHIRTTGKVVKVDDAPAVIVGGDKWGLRVRCKLASDSIDKAARLSKGDRVTITGEVDGKVGFVRVQDCRI